MKETNVLHNLYQKICKDTGERNESPKLIVVVRLLILTMIVYSLVNAGLFLFFSNMSGIGICLLSTALFVATFILSYRRGTFVSFCILNVTVLVWIIFNIVMFGWNIGVQHFIIVLLISCFFAKYRHEAAKTVYATALCILRLYLFFYCRANTPEVILAAEVNNTLQLVNTVAIFWSLAMIAYIFSTDTQAMEGKLIEYNEQLQRQASIDPLTGLYNRRRTTEYLDKLLKAPEYQISLCICDIDFFKRVNDTYGHDIGDVVLKRVAETFRKELPPDTFVSRWGGEEFLLIFPKLNGDEANIALEAFRRKIKAIVFDGGSATFSVSLTFGLVEYDFSSDMDTLIKQADEKLYIGKESGRDRIIF